MTTLTLVALAITSYIIINLYYYHYTKRRPNNLPPGPTPLPIIGNLHLLHHLPHRSLFTLAQKYGPIMSIHLGQIPAIVVSSPKTAQLILKQHDAIFSNRPKIEAWLYGSRAMGFTPYGEYWRRVRIMCTQHLLSARKIKEFEGMRERMTEKCVRRLAVAAAAREMVDVNVVVGELIQDMAMGMIVGYEENDGDCDKKRYELKEVIGESLRLAGLFNLGDFLPFLKPLDLQGITKNVKHLRNKADEIFDNIIEDHLKEEDCTKSKDILSTMLDLTKNENQFISSFSHENVKGIMFELFAGGIDTTLATITWALAALLKNPQTMKNLQHDLEVSIGRDNMVREQDLPKLLYLDMVVKETSRLYPIAPLLIPHESMDDVVMEGYMIPKNSRIMVNTWAIGHDPNVWSNNVEEFYPERFIDSTIDVFGHHFELLPFGSGRRICPGLKLGLINVKLILAQLVHCFDWELPNGMKTQEIDMTEKYGLSMPRAKHLLAIPLRRMQAFSLN